MEGYVRLSLDKYVCSFSKLKSCIDYIKQHGVV